MYKLVLPMSLAWSEPSYLHCTYVTLRDRSTPCEWAQSRRTAICQAPCSLTYPVRGKTFLDPVLRLVGQDELARATACAIPGTRSHPPGSDKVTFHEKVARSFEQACDSMFAQDMRHSSRRSPLCDIILESPSCDRKRSIALCRCSQFGGMVWPPHWTVLLVLGFVMLRGEPFVFRNSSS